MDGRDRITTKLFIGLLITSEVKMHLQNSPFWRNAKAMPNEEHLIEVRHRGKNYIGCYLKEEGIQLKDLKKMEIMVTTKIGAYLPQLSLSNDDCVVFPQLFIR